MRKVRALWIVAGSLAAVAGGLAHGEPPLAYDPSRVITKGGTYTVNYRSKDSATTAITVRTTGPVEITYCRPRDAWQAKRVRAGVRRGNAPAAERIAFKKTHLLKVALPCAGYAL